MCPGVGRAGPARNRYCGPDRKGVSQPIPDAAGCSCDRGLQLLRGGPQPWGGEADRDVDPGDDRGDQ